MKRVVCPKGIHNLMEIWRDHGAGSDAVVRWCRNCGAVVVDEDYDGRTNAGAYREMEFLRSNGQSEF